MTELTEITKKYVLLIVALATGIGGLAGWLGGSYASRHVSGTGVSGNALKTVIEEEAAVVAVADVVNSAVVSIVIAREVGQPDGITGGFPFDDWFGFPFRIEEPAPSPGGTLQRVGGGSGFIVDPEGLIVTNKHVVADESAIYTVMLSNGEEYPATVVARDPVLDVALIKIEAENLPTVVLGNSDQLKIGQTAIAIGYALAEYGNTVTKGVISGIGRRVVAGDGFGMSEVIEEAIQTDAAINPGNSGGPLLNIRGEVIGINTAISREGQLVGFAIPINAAKRTIESVRAHGRVIRPWLGVRYIPVTPRLAAANELPVTYGALVSRGQESGAPAIVPGSPAEQIGLRENDIILEVDGRKLEDKDSLGKEIARHEVGDSIKLKVLRNGEEKIVTVTLTEFPTKL